VKEGKVFLESVELFAVLVGFFLLGLAVFAVALYWFSRQARRGFDGTNSRLSEVSFYLNEFAKAAARLREKSGEKATAAFVEKKLVSAAADLEEEREILKEKEKRRLVAVRAAGKRKDKER